MKLPTATRVAGSDPLKMNTPSNPLPQPAVAHRIPQSFPIPCPLLGEPSAAGPGGDSDGPIQLHQTVLVLGGLQMPEAA
ncbi:hypothetical protein GCM10022293_51070 [Azospirillum formosense]